MNNENEVEDDGFITVHPKPAPLKNARFYTEVERAMISRRGAPCLTCDCTEDERDLCEAW